MKVKAKIGFMYGGVIYLKGNDLEVSAIDIEPLTAKGYIEKPAKKAAKRKTKASKEAEG